MSIKKDKGLLEKYREVMDVGSMKVKILREQIQEVVVADLISKYKYCAEQNNEYKDSFAKVLRYYLTEEEFKEIEEI